MRKIRSTKILGIIILSLFYVPLNIIAQNNFGNLPSGLSAGNYILKPEERVIQRDSEKDFLLPAIEVIGLNLTVGAFNTYVSNEDFAKISFKTIGENFETGFVWDEDDYLTNQFLHPFHGANYFNAARSNGLEFWESTPYAIGGSLMWEFFMENEPPSYNDLVNTSVTGITFGEISYRVSNLIIDESTTGLERILRELTSTVINPMQGFNRLIKGDMWKSGTSNHPPNYSIILSTGAHNVFFENDISKTYAAFRANLVYGNIYDVKNHNSPFEYFSLHGEVNIAEGDDIIGIFASGVLTDKKVDIFNNSNNIIGLYKEVDFLSNEVYKLTATSITGRLINRVDISSLVEMENNITVSGILMGGTNSQYAAEEGKDYNLGPGASGSIGVKFLFDDYAEVYSNYKRYWIHTLAGADGEEFVGLLMTGINYHIFEKTTLGLEFLLYERYGEYEKYPDYSSSNAALRFYVKYSI
ncbi:MAG: DUF3943 domain-containing protein [Melioribacteraceae bacterium]|jgi:hypothetical protein|nr:DUF3943 domain-containing protein [Melioribacteraceae bacterium]